MATAKELFDAGRLRAAIDAVTAEVKSKPLDLKSRTFLFELLCFSGELDRAERQLDVIGSQSAEAELGVQVYRNNLKAERQRGRLFTEGLEPHFLTTPPAYVDLHLRAINRVREGNLEEARRTLDQAEEERPAITGVINGRQFFDFRECDDLIGGVLELIVHDNYTWLPFEQIRRVEVPKPKQLRDLMWASARIEGIDGTIGEVFIPALYVRSSEHPNDDVKLGRMTEWQDLGGGLLAGAGLRLLLVDDDDVALFEAGQIEFGAIGADARRSGVN